MNSEFDTLDKLSLSTNSSIAELLGTPGDVPVALQAKFFPFLSKAMQLSNLSHNDILDIQADNELSRIEEINGRRRYEVSKESSRGDYIKQRAHTQAALSLSSGGFLVKQLTTIHKSVSYNDGHKSTGILGSFGSFFKRNGGQNG